MTPAGKPASSRQLGDAQGRQRRLLGRLHHDGVAAGQGRTPLPGQHQQREVPGDDLADDADRLPQRVRQEAAAHRHRLALDLVGPAGVVAERVDRRLPCRRRESVMVLPQLSDSRAASSAAFFSMRSASLNMSLPRSAASILLQGPDSRARRAALTALSTSGAVAAATLAMTSPVAGLIGVEVLALGRLDPLVVDEQARLLDGRGGGAFQRRLRHGGKPSW